MITSQEGELPKLMCQNLERAYWNEKKRELTNFKSCDPKEFWRKFNMERKAKSFDFSKSELFNYFKKLADNINSANGDKDIEGSIRTKC